MTSEITKDTVPAPGQILSEVERAVLQVQLRDAVNKGTDAVGAVLKDDRWMARRISISNPITLCEMFDLAKIGDVDYLSNFNIFDIPYRDSVISLRKWFTRELLKKEGKSPRDNAAELLRNDLHLLSIANIVAALYWGFDIKQIGVETRIRPMAVAHRIREDIYKWQDNVIADLKSGEISDLFFLNQITSDLGIRDAVRRYFERESGVLIGNG